METKNYNFLDSKETEKYAFLEKKIWNPKNFVVLSIVFSYLPVAIFYSLNYGRLGYSKKRTIFMISSIVVYVLLITLVIFANTLVASLFTGLNIGLGIYFRSSQKELYNKHIE